LKFSRIRPGLHNSHLTGHVKKRDNAVIRIGPAGLVHFGADGVNRALRGLQVEDAAEQSFHIVETFAAEPGAPRSVTAMVSTRSKMRPDPLRLAACYGS
jgi:hypothetical protein